MPFMKLAKGKKAYLKTVEAAIAIVLSFMFIVYFIPTKPDTKESLADLDILTIMDQDSTFRRCAIAENYSCMNATFESYYPEVTLSHDYLFNVSTNPRISDVSLPPLDIRVESIMIAGNDTYLRPKTIRLYYWPK